MMRTVNRGMPRILNNWVITKALFTGVVDAANRSHFLSGAKKMMDQVRKKVTIRCINRQRFAKRCRSCVRFSTLAGSKTGDFAVYRT